MSARGIPYIARRSIIVLLVLALAGVAAYMSEQTGSTFGHFTTGGIDLKIDSKSWYNGQAVSSATWAMKNLTPTADKFFNFPDIKPGDTGCEVVSMHVQKGEAWLCLDFKNLSSKENGVNEPESQVPDTNGSTKGELADNLQFFGWVDNGDNTYKPGERILFGTSTKAASTVLNDKSYPIGDSKSGNSCRQNDSRYVGMCWCAGVLTVNAQTGKMSCDGSALGNIAQTDTMTLDVGIRAISSTGDPKFLCNAVQTPPPTPKPKIKYFDAEPEKIKKGKSSTLSWSVTNATSLSIDQGVGTVTGSSKVVSPSATRTYKLTATGPGGTDTATVTVTVKNY